MVACNPDQSEAGKIIASVFSIAADRDQACTWTKHGGGEPVPSHIRAEILLGGHRPEKPFSLERVFKKIKQRRRVRALMGPRPNGPRPSSESSGADHRDPG